MSVSRQNRLLGPIVNGVEKYANETTEIIEEKEHRTSGNLVANARPRVKSTKNADTQLRSSTRKGVG